jgi:protein-S-isoprenylcysteine O-methyltransferase Ste14
MWACIICAVVWIGFILHWIFGSIPKRLVFEIYAGCGISICLMLLIFRLFGLFQNQKDVLVLQVVGTIFYFVAILMAVITFVTIGFKGKPKGSIEDTTVLIERGIFQIVRHPLYLALAFWSIGLVLLTQSFLSLGLGMTALFCFWMSSQKEDAFNIKKFGDSYRRYMRRVPKWNVLRGLKRTFYNAKRK